MVVACVLRSGGDFRPEHVQWLAKQVPGLVCLSDVSVPGVETISLAYDWPGWFAKMEMFGPSLEGDVLMADLDTVVLGMPAVPRETTVLRDFTRPGLMGSGFMFVTEADRKRVWDSWIADPAGHMKAHRRLGDQGFMQDIIGDCAKWGDEVCSYKEHVRGKGVPEGAKVVCFHGKPRPWDVREAWIPKLGMCNDFRDLILAHKGKRICVMGGGPTLAENLERVEADVYLSTNGHGADLRRPDYVVAMDDDWHGVPRIGMHSHIRALTDAPTISPRPWADYQLTTWPDAPKTGVLTGMVATWVAWAMGARVVILAGMDAYDGSPRGMAHCSAVDRDVKCPIRVVGGGPLTKFWPAYDPKETFGRYKPHPALDALRGLDGRTRVRALKPVTVRHHDMQPGEEMTVMRHEVHRLLRHRMLEEITQRGSQ